MGLSGRSLAALVAATVLVLAGASCETNGEVAGFSAPASTQTSPAVAPRPAGAQRSPEALPPVVALDPSKAAAAMPLLKNGRVLQPVAAVGERIVISENATGTASPAAAEIFALWDPATGEFSPAWTGDPGSQDIVSGADGAWVATVRTGMDLPFAQWTLILRNIETGETREPAKSDPVAPTTPGLRPDLPTGLAPLPSISGGQVAWDQLEASPGGAAKSVRLYTIATGRTEVLARVPDATREDLRLPSVSGGRVAWIHRRYGSGTASIETVAPGEEAHTFRSGGSPWSVTVFDGGARIAWDDNLGAKYVADVATGQARQYASTEGWGTVTNGTLLSWTPAGAQGGRAGFFDPGKNELQLVPSTQRGISNVATLLGPWFAWQVLTPGESAAGKYYFLRVG